MDGVFQNNTLFMIHTKHQKLIEHVLVVMHGMEQLAEPICVCVLKLKLDMHNSTHALHNRLDQFVGNEE